MFTNFDKLHLNYYTNINPAAPKLSPKKDSVNAHNPIFGMAHKVQSSSANKS